MKNLNIGPFWVGQKVVAISSGAESGRIKDKVYIVLAVKRPLCGCWVIDVGLKMPKGKEYVYCPQHLTSIYGSTLWQGASNFAPLQQSKFPLMTFSEIKVKEQEQVLSDN